ncbi:MAG: hypothetical protein WBD93_07465, partial [Acidobacteriaceae bacterium]
MTHGEQATRQGAGPGRRVAFALTALVSLAMLAGPGAWAQRRGGGGGGQAARPAPAPRQQA